MVSPAYKARAAGFSMVEILVTLVIVMIGLLGLLGVQVRSHQAELEAYQRAQALVLMTDMVDRMNANRQGNTVDCYVNANNGTPYLGVGNTVAPACGSTGSSAGTAATRARADADLGAWDNLLKGAAETDGGNVGAMLGARGCISVVDAAARIYRVSIAWQGLIATGAPLDAGGAAITCGTGLYGNENLRRAVTTTVRIATLL